jgi:sugar/nucleoside kinase (ribokinase family)
VPQTLPIVAAVKAASPAASGARAQRTKVIVAGGLVCDVIAKMTADGPAKYQKEGPQHQTSTNNSYKGQFEGLSVPGHVTFSPGGVGRNIAEAIVRLLGPQNVIFTSVTGSPNSDPFSKLVLDHMTQLGMSTNYVNVLDKPGLRTPLYHAALYPNGELKIGINCMEMFDHFTPEMVRIILSWHCINTFESDLQTRSTVQERVNRCRGFEHPRGNYCNCVSISSKIQSTRQVDRPL